MFNGSVLDKITAKITWKQILYAISVQKGGIKLGKMNRYNIAVKRYIFRIHDPLIMKPSFKKWRDANSTNENTYSQSNNKLDFN